MSNLLLMAALKNAGVVTPPVTPSDTNFSNVAMLLHGEGSNGVGTAAFVAAAAPSFTKTGLVAEGSFTPYNTNYSTYFPGSGVSVTVPNIALGTNAFTCEMWINFPSLNTNNCDLIDFRTIVGNMGFVIGIDGTGHVYFYDGPNNNQITASSVLSTNTWYHIAACRDTGGAYRVYVNGTSVITGTSATDMGTQSPMIGCARNGSQYSFTGYMSNLRLVVGTSLYTSSFTPPTSQLTAIAGTQLLMNSGSTVDSSVNNVTWTINNGSVTFSAFGPFGGSNSGATGNSVWMDGTTGYLSSTSPNVTSSLAFGTSDFTVECWVYLTGSSTNNNYFIDTRPASGATNQWYMGYVSTNGNLYFSYGAASLCSVFAPRLNQWVHVAYTRSGTTGRLFINGVQSATVTDNINYLASQLLIGNSAGLNAFLNGYITDIRVVNGTARYTANFTPSKTPLTTVANTALLYNASTVAGSGVYDSAAQQNIATQGSVALNSTAPKFGSTAMSFNGATTSYLQIPPSQFPAWGSANWTVECWAYPTTANQTSTLITPRTGPNNYGSWSLELASGAVKVLCSTSGSSWAVNFTSSANVTTNAWNHIAAVRNGSSVTCYLNGVNVGSGAISGSLMSSATVPLLIGTNGLSTSGGTLLPFTGYMDDVRITYGVARYTSAFTPPSSAFGNSLASDSNFNSVVLLAHFDGPSGAANTSVAATFPLAASSVSLTKNGTLSEGTNTPYGPNWSTYFAGGGACLTAPASTNFGFGTGAFTVECWVNQTVSNSNALNFIDFRTSNTVQALAVGINSNGYFYFYDGGFASSFADSSAPVVNGQWYHIALTRDGSGLWSLYKNGVLAVSHTSSASVGTTQPVTIGQSISGAASGFTGFISNVRIVKGSALYTAPFTPPTAPLTAVSGTVMLTLQSYRNVDNSSAATPLTPTNAPAVSHYNPFGSGSDYTTSTFGGSTLLDGTTGYLTTSSSSAYQFAGDFTLEAWVNPASLSSETIFGYWTSGTPTACGFIFQFTSSGFLSVSYGVGSSSSSFTGTTSKVVVNQWNHVAVTRKGSTIRLFVNGVMDSTVGTGISGTTNTTSNGLYIGALLNSTVGNFTNGYMTEARIVNGTALYTGNFTPSTSVMAPVPNTVLWYRAQGASTNGIYDNALQQSVIPLGSASINTTQAKFGSSSLYFDGTVGSGLKVANTPSLNLGSQNFTIEGWVYPTALSTSATYFTGIFGQRDAETYTGLIIEFVGNKFATMGSINGTSWGVSITSAGTYTTNAWYHFAVVRNGTNITMYVNGTAIGSSTGAGTSAFSNNGSTYIGTSAGTVAGNGGSYSSYPLTGYLDDFRITLGIARYTGNFTVPSSSFPNK